MSEMLMGLVLMLLFVLGVAGVGLGVFAARRLGQITNGVNASFASVARDTHVLDACLKDVDDLTSALGVRCVQQTPPTSAWERKL